MGDVPKRHVEDILGDIDLDSILQGFPNDFDLDLDLSPELWLHDLPKKESNSPNSNPSGHWIPESDPLPGESNSPGSLSSYTSELERFLMDEEAQVGDEGDGAVGDDFFADLFVDGSDSGKSEVATPEADARVESEGKEKSDEFVVVDTEEEGDDPISKKRRRQIRNRDSAMKSRERRKMHVKDLEVKSRYLESECRRLDYALQCCMMENMALHQRLQKKQPLGALMAKQESAVLFVESLLLGSLFWLVSIVCLFLTPGLQSLNIKDASRLGRGLAPEAVGPTRVANNKLGPDSWHELFNLRRRCRGMRTRMKLFLLPLHSVSA